MPLRAVVIGAGWAGEGHTLGLRAAGVEVIALCGRTPEPAYQRAAQLGISDVRFDWHAALTELQPDIVTIATPADSHRAIAELAAQLGCHVVCEKPLAANATDAQAMRKAVQQAGVKHGYAATGCYAPTILQTRRLLAEGRIGRVHEIESFGHFNLPLRGLPYCWFHRLEQGGGLLHNGFTHKLAQVLYATQGTMPAVAGEARVLVDQAAVGPSIHDFRQLFGLLGTWNPTQATEWRAVDADGAYTVNAQIRLPDGNVANALFRASLVGSTPQPEYLVFHGEAGSLFMSGAHGADDRIQRLGVGQQAWEEVPLEPAILAGPPQTPDRVQRCWHQFFGEFVADVQGEGKADYPTFDNGYTAAAVIDVVRKGYDWQVLQE